MWANADCGWGKHDDIFSSLTTRQTSARPEATCHQPAMGENTPVPPPVKTRMYGRPMPPHPSERYSPFM